MVSVLIAFESAVRTLAFLFGYPAIFGLNVNSWGKPKKGM